VDGAELAVRAVLGQQVTVAAARTLAARLVTRYGTELAEPVGAITHLFPDPATLAAAELRGLGMPTARLRALSGLADALAAGDLVLDPGADRSAVHRQLLDLPGIGPWTASYVIMRAVGDPDVFLPTDVGVRHGLERLGAGSDPKTAAALAERWRPWRSYALLHLWGSAGSNGRN
jgi:AraC family transcriptional regulator of adaptative response / DNA-3-methyladenine glycosylase II